MAGAPGDVAALDDALAVRKPSPPEERPDIWKSEGNARLVKGDDAGAVECYTRGIDAAQQGNVAGKLLSQLHSNRALAHSKLGDHAQALDDCEIAIDNDGLNAKAYWRGATAALKLERNDVAASICKKGMEAVGDSLGLSSILEDARLAAAKEQQQRLEEKGPGPAAAGRRAIKPQDIADRGVALLERYMSAPIEERREEDVRSAKRLFEKVISDEPNNEMALVSLGHILDEGLGCERDPLRAGELWMQAKEAGSRRGQLKLCLQGLQSWALMIRSLSLQEDHGPNHGLH